MTRKRSILKPLLGVLALFAVLGGAFTVIVGNGPSMELNFSRDVPSKATVAALGGQLSDLKKWPEWFFSLKEARVVSETGEALPKDQQVLSAGSRITLFIEPKTKQWKRFQLQVRVESYRPNEFLRLQILSDSKGKLNALFENLVWQISILPSPQLAHSKDGAPNLSLIRGEVVARGISWRSKVFGTVTPRILLAQVFYPDLIKLAETGFEQPKSMTSGVDGS